MASTLHPKGILLCLLIFCLCAFAREAAAQQAQDTTAIYLIKTRDGNKYVGQIVDQNDEFILFRTKNLSEITIAREDIVEMSLLGAKNLVEESLWPENLQSTRYFWAPNAYNLRSGEGYYQNIWILFNQASIGVTDRFSVGLGTVPLFLFGGTSTPSPVWITPKFSVPLVKDKWNIGVGALAGKVLGEDESSFGIMYGITTFGNRNRNASIGIGYGFGSGGVADIPVFTASGMLRVNKKWYLLSENYFISVNNDTFALMMFGARVMFNKVGLDFGLVAPYFREVDGLYTLPWLGFTVPFGKH